MLHVARSALTAHSSLCIDVLSRRILLLGCVQTSLWFVSKNAVFPMKQCCCCCLLLAMLVFISRTLTHCNFFRQRLLTICKMYACRLLLLSSLRLFFVFVVVVVFAHVAHTRCMLISWLLATLCCCCCCCLALLCLCWRVVSLFAAVAC